MPTISLRLLDVDRIHSTTLGVLLRIEGNLVTLLQTVEAGWVGNSIPMEEEVLILALNRDETEILAFHLFLYNTCVHRYISGLLTQLSQ